MAHKTDLPQILSANTLLDGHVVWWTGEGWSAKPGDARLMAPEAAAAALADALAQPGALVGPYLSPATDADGVPLATEVREQIRAHGPTFDPALVLPGALPLRETQP